ncbi:MAG: TIM barrel protein [Oscillospiraceae bacterium]|nr:TIM barrel protein [Oscillospiraceae bacterium]
MKLCVPIPCFFPSASSEEVCAAIRAVADLGYDTVELYDWRMLKPDDVRDVLIETGVELRSILVPENRLTAPACRELWLSSLQMTCEAAVRLGVKHAITQVGNDTGAPRAHQHDVIVQTLKAAKPILEYYGVTVMPEPLNVKVNHPGYYLTKAEEAFDVVREVDSPYVKVIYDIYHQQITEGDIIPTVTANLDCIAHLHAAGHPGRHELWEGELNYRYIFDVLDRVGYTGACGLEYAPMGDPAESLRRARELYG